MSFLAANKKEEAIQTLEDLASANPTNSQIYYYLGELYLDHNDLEKATLNFSLAATASETTREVSMRVTPPFVFIRG